MRLLRRLAREVLGDEVSRKVWGRVEIIGDIAVIRKPPDVDLEILRILANELMRRLKYVKSVWAAVTPVAGTYRVREYVHLAGEERSETTYREHGCVFRVDIREVYISPVLNYEHIRVAKKVGRGEYVINMFAGVGLFSIIIAKHAAPSKVISIDINPTAYRLMVENIRLNKVDGVVEAVLGDACEIVKKYRGMADRVLMPLPELSVRCLPQAIEALKDKGVVHVYEFVTATSRDVAVVEAKKVFGRVLDKLDIAYDFEEGRVVRSVGPRYYQVVLDIKISKRI